MYLFTIAHADDTPLLTLHFHPPHSHQQSVSQNALLHASIDHVDQLLFATNQMQLKTVDKVNEYFVNAFVTHTHTKFLMLHDTKNDDKIKHFFQDVYELYAKAIANPFYQPSQPLGTKFEQKVLALGKQHAFV